MRALLLALLIGGASAETLQVEANDGEAQTLLATHLDLARALAQRERLPFDELERERLCALTPDQTRELLGTLGRFQPVRIELDCGAARLKVDVGPQALVRRLDFLASGASETQLAEWREILALREGDAFTQARWSEAKRALLVRLRAAGQPLARWDSTQAQVDVEAKAVDLRLNLDPGVTVRIARIDITGLKHHDEKRVRELMGLQEGRRVRETALVAAQERLLKSGLFDAVQIEVDMEALAGDRAPIKVELREAPLQQLGLGLGWSSNSGERVTLEHQHRLAFGWPLRSNVKLAWARDTQSIDLELSAHPGAQQRRNLGALRWEREEGIEAPYRQAAIRLGQVYETRRHDRSLLVEALSSRQGVGQQATRSEALLFRWDPTWRELDSVLLPTRGQALLLQTAIGPARSRGELADDRHKGGVARLHARWQYWKPLNEGRGLHLRLEAGQVFAPRELVLPESLRWRAGGDESVRGYSYRSLGPRQGNQEVGGRVVWTASVEASQPLSKSWVGGLDGLAAAAFVDAGQAAERWKEASPAWGFGAGVRWRSPVGLLRADIAKGEKSQGGGWRLHIAVGLAL